MFVFGMYCYEATKALPVLNPDEPSEGFSKIYNKQKNI
jgi:hypothetical protein